MNNQTPEMRRSDDQTTAPPAAATPGAFNEVDRIRRMALRRPRDAFVSQARLDEQWRPLNYPSAPDFGRAIVAYDQMVELFENCGIRLDMLPADQSLSIDSIYVRDCALSTPRGVVLCNMGKPARAAEPAVLGAALNAAGVTIAGAISGEGVLEGGDVVWLDAATCLVGRSYRTNEAGVAQLRALFGDDAHIAVYHMPHHKGPGDVFHLMSVLSPIDHDLALVYAPLLPIPLREALLNRGVALVEVPDEEFASLACNALTLAPRRCLVVGGNPRTRRLLERHGVQVTAIDGAELCAKGEGGPTCLTLPLVRG